MPEIAEPVVEVKETPKVETFQLLFTLCAGNCGTYIRIEDEFCISCKEKKDDRQFCNFQN